MFLSGWLGGPGLYAERFGHPMLRATPAVLDQRGRARRVDGVRSERWKNLA
jgi:truncated hemoglobin YjbI